MNGMKLLKSLNKKEKLLILTTISIILFGCCDETKYVNFFDRNGFITSSSNSVEDSKQISVNEEFVREEQEVNNEYIYPEWTHYENQMEEEDRRDFNEYLPVLKNEERFLCFEWNGNREMTFEEYLSSLMSEKKPEIVEIALVDLDNQNGKELIMEIYEGGGNYLILTRDNGKIYGTNMGDRCFEELQKDGKYIGSGGAITAYYRTMKIDSNGVEEYQFGERKEEERDGGYFGKLIVNGKYIEDYDKWFEENYSDPVDWIQ